MIYRRRDSRLFIWLYNEDENSKMGVVNEPGDGSIA